MSPLHGLECQDPSTKPFRGGCNMYFLFSSSGLVNDGVTHTPKIRIPKSGEKVTVVCDQDMNHNHMYWNLPDLGHGLRMIYYSVAAGVTDKGDVPIGN